jgi:hypothetical protein
MRRDSEGRSSPHPELLSGATVCPRTQFAEAIPFLGMAGTSALKGSAVALDAKDSTAAPIKKQRIGQSARASPP